MAHLNRVLILYANLDWIVTCKLCVNVFFFTVCDTRSCRTWSRIVVRIISEVVWRRGWLVEPTPQCWRCSKGTVWQHLWSCWQGCEKGKGLWCEYKNYCIFPTILTYCAVQLVIQKLVIFFSHFLILISVINCKTKNVTLVKFCSQRF